MLGDCSDVALRLREDDPTEEIYSAHGFNDSHDIELPLHLLSRPIYNHAVTASCSSATTEDISQLQRYEETG